MFVCECVRVHVCARVCVRVCACVCLYVHALTYEHIQAHTLVTNKAREKETIATMELGFFSKGNDLALQRIRDAESGTNLFCS